MSSKVPRRNRVTPFSVVEASAEKGRFLGNRGDLHNHDGTIGNRKWQHQHWIICALQSQNGYRVPFDTPGSYTPLFFHDERVALAAGHRPCAQCRKPAYRRFVAAWEKAHGLAIGSLRSNELDKVLHAARTDGPQKRTFKTEFDALPDGVFIQYLNIAEAVLVAKGSGRIWSHAGYGNPFDISPEMIVTVLTPKPVVAVLKAGFIPDQD